MGSISSRIINAIFSPTKTIKYQLILSFTIVSVVASSLTLMVCYAVLYSMATTTYKNASTTVVSRIKSNLYSEANEIANVINQQLVLVAESISMTGALHSKSLMDNDAAKELSTSSAYDSFKSYNFLSQNLGNFPIVPHDFGLLKGRSRFPPNLPDFEYGSTDHSSVYLYNSVSGIAALNDSEWDNILSHDTHGIVNRTINNLAYQDRDLHVQFTRGPNTTVMFYVSAQVMTSGQNNAQNYVSVHRTFPGIDKPYYPATGYYNAPGRSWFKYAPLNAYYLYGPYQETFTKQPVLTLSSRQSSTLSSGGGSYTVNLVTAAVMLLSDIVKVVQSVSYPNNGFGALVTIPSLKVIAWKDLDTFNATTGQFLSLKDIDVNLASSFAAGSTTTYTDPTGASWYVSSVPFFTSTPYTTNIPANSLMMLVFASQSDANKPLAELDTEITSTTESVTIETIVLIYGMVGFILIVVYFLVSYITAPLTIMREVSQEITHMAAEEEENKDYSDIVKKSFLKVERSDEVGVLAREFYKITCLLHNKNVEKKERPKYPINPFCVDTVEDPAHMRWPDFFAAFLARYGSSAAAIDNYSGDTDTAATADPEPTDDLDVLGSLVGAKPVAKANPIAVTEATAIEMTDRSKRSEFSTRSAVSHEDVTATVYVEMPTESQRTTIFSSIKNKFAALSTLIGLGIVIIMIITVAQLRVEGYDWMKNAGVTLEDAQMENLNTIASIKALYVEIFYKQITMDMLAAGAYLTAALDNNITSLNDRTFPNLIQKTPAYPSNLIPYSLDQNNPLRYTPGQSPTPSPNIQLPENINYFSGYFLHSDAGCSQQACEATYNSTFTRLTSVVDLKLESLFYQGSYLSFLQYGLELNGYTRQYPYPVPALDWGQPTKCYVQDLKEPQCLNSYQASSYCQNGIPPGTTPPMGSLPPYDPRCRSWYQSALKTMAENGNLHGGGDPNQVYFGLPRTSSSGSVVITSVLPIKQYGLISNPTYGVMNFNVLFNALSASINSIKILDSGYIYVIDSTNSSLLVLSPVAPKGCYDLLCAERFSASEYAAFQTSVLNPIQSNAKYGTNLPVANSYTKGGVTWRLAYSPVKYGTISYTLISTVPLSEIIATSTSIETAINTTVVNMIVAFVLVGVFFLFCLYRFTRYLIRKVVDPFIELKEVCTAITEDDLEKDLPVDASSLDSTVLLDAFSNLLIALRFSSDKYARGASDVHSTEKVFTEALELYTTTKNNRGIGAAHNNLGAIKMSCKEFRAAEEHYKLAIANADAIIARLGPNGNPSELDRARRVRSDRCGNLAVLYLEEKRFQEAFDLLEKLLHEDKQFSYIKGCVVKQGTLGQYYQTQGEMKSAERIFLSALDFIRRKDQSLFNAQWNMTEASAAEQIALANIASLRLTEEETGVAEQLFLEALGLPKTMHSATVTKVLRSLRDMFTAQQRLLDADQVLNLAKANGFNILGGAGGSGSMASGPKRVAFCVDYSGSMSGSKIRSAMDNVQSVFRDHIKDSDFCMLIHFSHIVNIDFPLLQKGPNVTTMSSKIAELTSPNGTTAFRDAVVIAIDAFKTSPANDWIVALTDGEDNASKVSQESLKQRLRDAKCNLIVIGVGHDVHAAELQALTKSSKKGVYISADGNKDSITEAFGKVAALIQGQVILEEM